MPQEQNILKCFSCETFQVHIVKKANKWECKICGAKQSFKRSYGQGSGKDCRLHVMKLNELRLKKESNVEKVNSNQSCTKNVNDVNITTNLTEKKTVTNKWFQYIDDDELEDLDLDNDEIDVIEVKENVNKRKRTDDTQLICENNFKKICNQKGTSENCKLPNEIFEDIESHLNKNYDFTISSSLKKYKEENNSELSHCIKKSSNIFNSNPNDLEDLINISF